MVKKGRKYLPKNLTKRPTETKMQWLDRCYRESEYVNPELFDVTEEEIKRRNQEFVKQHERFVKSALEMESLRKMNRDKGMI